jgi:DNA-binding XRE family transcriptional regulator
VSERGAVEIKPPGDSLATLAQSDQVHRFLVEYGLCLIANYHQFQLVELRDGQPSVMESYDLTRTTDDRWNLPAAALAKRHAERRLRTLRDERGWTQQQLADLAGIGRVHVSELENGRREPGLRVIAMLGKSFDLSASQMLSGIKGGR